MKVIGSIYTFKENHNRRECLDVLISAVTNFICHRIGCRYSSLLAFAFSSMSAK